MDEYQDVRSIPLVLASLGFTGFKKRPGKKEHYGKCPFHQPKKKSTSFSFTDEKFNYFSYDAYYLNVCRTIIFAA